MKPTLNKPIQSPPVVIEDTSPHASPSPTSELASRRRSSDTSAPRTFTDLPRELVQQVAGNLSSPDDVMNLALVTRPTREDIQPATYQARLIQAATQATTLAQFQMLLDMSGEVTKTGQPKSILKLRPEARRAPLAALARRLTALPWADVSTARDLLTRAITQSPLEQQQELTAALDQAAQETSNRQQFAPLVVAEAARQHTAAQQAANRDTARVGANLRALFE
jgi:hypothetical protein